MLRFFSASTNIANSKRAIRECLEKALKNEPDIRCDLLIIYSGMGHNFRDLVGEARNLTGARVAGCTCGGIILQDITDESMTVLAVMAIKGPSEEFALVHSKTRDRIDPFSVAAEMAQELKLLNPGIRFLQFLPTWFEWAPHDLSLEGLKSVFGKNIPVFGSVSIDNGKGVTSFHFFDDEVVERGAVLVGYADPTLEYISRANHGFSFIEGMPLVVTKTESNRIYELNNKPAWQEYVGILGLPESIPWLEAHFIASFATNLPEELKEKNNSSKILFTPHDKNDDGSINTSITCKQGTELWLTKRDETKMFEGAEKMAKEIKSCISEKVIVAVFHSDCLLRGRFTLNRIKKEELIHLLQKPICMGMDIPWFGMYGGGEYAVIGEETIFQQLSSALFVLYR
jgi:hypothetical protein